MQSPGPGPGQAEPQKTPTALGLDATLESLLRGAALLLGCNSATLLIVDPERRDATVRVGVVTDQAPMLRAIEDVFSASLAGASFPVESLEGALVLEAWARREVLETSSLAELVGAAFPAEVVNEVAGWIGARRYILVPVARGDATYGIVLFEKASPDPFSVQQREIMLRYAHRLGEILENDVRSLGSSIAASPAPGPDGSSSVTHQLLRLALSEVSPTFTVSPDLRVTGCNHATRRLLGYEPGELVGRDVASLFDEPADIRAVLDPRFLLLANGVHEEVFSLRHRDGHALRASVKALVLADGRHEVVGTLVLVRALRPGGGEGGPDAELAHLMRQERLATMGELAAQLAHELRNPLLAIGATLAGLPDELDDRDRAVATLGELSAEVSRLDRTLRDYMSLSVRSNAAVASVDLGDLARSAAALVLAGRPMPPRFELSCAPEARVLGDREGLRQVLVNVLANAFDASPPEGTVTCRVERMSVPDGGASADQVRVVIDDEGPGPGPASEHCFEPFYTTKPHGTGLGLTVARRIVGVHGGEIVLRPRERRGARVIVTLPAVGGPAPEDHP